MSDRTWLIQLAIVLCVLAISSCLGWLAVDIYRSQPPTSWTWHYTVTVHDGPTKVDFHKVKKVSSVGSYQADREPCTVLTLEDGAEVRIYSGTVIIRPRVDAVEQ